MKLSDAFPSRYLRAADLDKPVLATIDSVSQQTIGDDLRIVIEFAERDLKDLVANVTNCRSIAKIVGSDDTDDWHGHRIVLYVTEVAFKGETVDAIRVRAPKIGKVAAGNQRRREQQTAEDPFTPEDEAPHSDADMPF